ncbi:OLC1v1036508C1 [Oldenlandia corymbosa var. corymbosa]|uniref:OLC1v1036508C1 n=1 Tax=Oldenlandia corymbosa var. corymbosa TaxID=529605 RepID=A0AAV1CY44_OLDCO|nr:OLC1v1036508C1 [Oldenlandia corymbosa var. corymbosa]
MAEEEQGPAVPYLCRLLEAFKGREVPRPKNKMIIGEAEGEDEADVNIAAAGGDSGGEQDNPESEEEEEALPIGVKIRSLGTGSERIYHYEAFTYNGNSFHIDDPVYLVPDEPNGKPRVAIIKSIAQKPDQKLVVTGRMLYRPGEAQRANFGCWKPRSNREVFYSFHLEEFPAERVMHKIVLHFIPRNKQIPLRVQHPGLIVQSIYDTELKRLYNLRERSLGERRQNEIDLLIQNTTSRLGDLPDLELDDEGMPKS